MANKFGIISNLIFSIFSIVGTAVYYSLTKTAQVATTVIEKVFIPAATIAGPVIGQTLITTALELPKFLLWAAEHSYSLLAGAITLSIAIYKIYGEESSYPILAIWSLVLAFGLYALHYLEETYKSAKKYVPFTN